MISDDEESLAGLTQVPSQAAIAQNDSSDDDSHGIFGLLPAGDLMNCSANVQADFSQFVTAIATDSESDSEKPETVIDLGDASDKEFSAMEKGPDPDLEPECTATNVSDALAVSLALF